MSVIAPAVMLQSCRHVAVTPRGVRCTLDMLTCVIFFAVSFVVGPAQATTPKHAQGAHAQQAAPEPVVSELMTRPLSNVPGKEVLILTVDYPPGGADPVHRHDAHGFVYVLEGSIVMGVKGGPERTLVAGQTFHEGPEDIHTVGRNASQTEPAKFLVFLLKDVGVPAVLPPD